MMLKKHYPGVLILVFLLIVMILLSCSKKEKFESYFPETGKAAVHQRALELQSNLNVLSIALEPGFEDLSALAYFRMGKGANIMSAYFTNGEAGENDLRGEYPNYLAATRRTEAAEALYFLDANAHFLNFPHIVAARDSEKVREKWVKSNIDNKVRALINQFQPDIILLARDWATNNRSLRWRIFKDDILAAVKKTESISSNSDQEKNWTKIRILVDDPEIPGKNLPIANQHPIYKKSYAEIADEAAEKYQSLSVQRPAWRMGRTESYSILYPAKDLGVEVPDGTLPARTTNRLRSLSHKIQNLTGKILADETKLVTRNLVAILDSVNYKIATRFGLSELDQRALFHWKEGLEELQCSLLGIKVHYSTDEKVLTNVQLILIYVNEVEGFEVGKNTSIYFGGLEQKWIINESKDKRVRLRLGDDYRLITPEELDYTTPEAKYGLQLARIDKPITLMIIHNAPTKEKSFIYRADIRLKFAPRFTTEVLTPVVRMIPGEKIVLRLTNHSRDGVRDTVRVVDEMAESVPGLFRLNKKEATYLDSLTLIWLKYPEIGTYKLPVKIGEKEVASFAARNFPVEVNKEKKIGIIPAIHGSPILTTMRRLGLTYQKLDPNKNLSGHLKNLDVLIVDRRALTLQKDLKTRTQELDNFVKKGGHLIFLAQNAKEWNESNIWEEVRLSDTQEFDETYPVIFDKNHPFLNSPNRLEEGDWGEWLYRRAFHTIEVKNSTNISVPIQTKGKKSPLVLTKPIENGRITYIDLAISHQLLNIHPGVFVLLANIISI